VPGSFAPGHQPDGNSVLIEGPRGVVLVDTGRHPAHVDAIESALAARHRPLVAIINSHWHLDHVSGNIRLKAGHPGVRVYASDAIDGALTGFLADSAKSARAYIASGKAEPAQRAEMEGDLATVDHGRELRPDVVITRPVDLKLGGRRLHVSLARNAATAGDVWLYDPATHLAVVGDLVTLPAPFLDTACPDGWSKALDQIAATRFTTLVPGHGAPMTRVQFQTYVHAYRNFVDCAAGKDTADVCAGRWLTDAGGLIAPTETRLGRGLATYYVGLLRGGSLAHYCPA